MACANVKVPEVTAAAAGARGGFKVKSGPGKESEAESASRIRDSMPALASILTAPSVAMSGGRKRRRTPPTEVATPPEEETVTIHGVFNTDHVHAQSVQVASKSPGSAREALKALLSSPVKGVTTNGTTHTYTTRRRTGAYHLVKKPSKYLSDDLVDSDVLYEMTKQNLLPAVPRPPRAGGEHVTGGRKAAAPRVSYIGLDTARQESAHAAKVHQKTAPPAGPSPAEKRAPGSGPAITVADTGLDESSFLKSLLVPHEYGTRTKSGTARIKSDVYEAIRQLADRDDADLSGGYSSPPGSDGDTAAGKARRRGNYHTRKRLDLDKDPAVYPVESASGSRARARRPAVKVESPASSYTSRDPSRDVSPELPRARPLKVPQTCSCRLERAAAAGQTGPRDPPQPVLALLLTSDELVEAAAACRCKRKDFTIAASDLPPKKRPRSHAPAAPSHDTGTPNPAPDSPAKCDAGSKTPDAGKKTSDAGKKSPMMASLLLTQMAKAVKETSEREYVTPPAGGDPAAPTTTTDKQYTNSPQSESSAASVLRLLLTTRRPDQPGKAGKKRVYRRRRPPPPRSVSSSPEPSALQALLMQKSDYLSEGRKRRAARSPEVVTRGSVYIDYAEGQGAGEEESGAYGTEPGTVVVHPTAPADDLPILNSLLSPKRRAPAARVVRRGALVVKPDAVTGYSGGRRIKQEPQPYDYNSASPGTSTSWGCIEVTAHQPKVICIQPVACEDTTDAVTTHREASGTDANPEYVDMEEVAVDDMPVLKITNVQSLSEHQDMKVDEAPDPPCGPVCPECGSAFKSVLLLALHKEKVHSVNRPRGAAKRKKSLNSIINSCFGGLAGGTAEAGGLASALGDLSRSGSSSPALLSRPASCGTSRSEGDSTRADIRASTDNSSSRQESPLPREEPREGSSSSGEGTPAPVPDQSDEGSNSAAGDRELCSEEPQDGGPGRQNAALPPAPRGAPPGDTPAHVCAQCEAGFPSRSALLGHQLSHRREAASYACSKCDRTFSLNDVYMKHVKKCQTP